MAPQPSQVLLLTVPRSGCYVLERMLSKQSTVQYLHQLCHASMFPLWEWLKSEDWKDGLPKALQEQHEAAVKEGFDQWEYALDKAQKAIKTLFMHTHCFSIINPDIIWEFYRDKTKVPSSANRPLVASGDQLLKRPGTVPIIPVRDPRLVAVSAYRGLNPLGVSAMPNLELCTSCIWSRIVYDWYIAQGVSPIIIDADDFMTSPEFVRKLCAEAGLNPEEAIFEWPEGVMKEGMNPAMIEQWVVLQQTLQNSSGLQPQNAAKNTDFATQEPKWEAEFGEEGWAKVQTLIEQSRPHYQYLYERRVRL